MYGIHYEHDKLHQIGINAITYDEDGTIHFYVDEITPQTKDKIDKELIIFLGAKIILFDKQFLTIKKTVWLNYNLSQQGGLITQEVASANS
ncbi:hypothetical protein [Bacillus sp. OAE603]|uniref:hypothetical protein n=1 Tax=Gottfriedia sp. OAE603 TaxID=2663872 RepID=UPI00178A11A3